MFETKIISQNHLPPFLMKTIGSSLILGMLFFQCVTTGTRADILDHWTTNQISTNSFAMGPVIYGGHRFVTVGSSYDLAYIYSSPDGLNWNLKSPLSNLWWGLRLFYSDGQFIGISINGSIATSTNGDDWPASYSIPSQYANYYSLNEYGVTYGNGIYVVTGDTNGTGFVITSTNGTGWIPISSLLTKNQAHIGKVVYGTNRFVAIGDDGDVYVGTPKPLPALTPYPYTWSRSSISVNGPLSYNNGLFIVSGYGVNLISRDGLNWASQPTGITDYLQAITYVDGLYMARTGGGLPATSVDGTNWIQYARQICGSDFATDGIRVVSSSVTNTGVDEQYNPVYNNFIYVSDPLVSISITNSTSPHITLSGLVGRNYQIQSSDMLPGQSFWCTNMTLQLTNPAYDWIDLTATNSQRFYRGALLAP